MNSSVSARDTAPADDAAYPAVAVFDLVASLVRLTPRDMTLTSLATLGTLWRRGPRRITELAASEGITQPSVTSLVTSLERAGFVERRSDPADGRVVLVAITDAGSAYLRVRRQANAEAIARAARRLAPEDFEMLVAAVPVLERLRALMEETDGVAERERQARVAAAAPLPETTPFPVGEL